MDATTTKADEGGRQLVTLVLGVLGASVVLAVGALALYRATFGGALSTDPALWGQFGDYLGGVLNPFLQFGALFGVVVSLAFTQRQLRLAQEQHREEREDADSRFYLEEARLGIESALKRVEEPGMNDRVTWILAARTLERSLAIADLITRPAAQRVWELALEGYRIRASDALGRDRTDRDAQFFYGFRPVVHDLDRPYTLEDAARASTANGTLNYLSESSLAAFWRLAQYPDKYPDPLPKEGLPVDPDHISMHSFPGLRAYLQHRREWDSIAGKLVARRKREDA